MSGIKQSISMIEIRGNIWPNHSNEKTLILSVTKKGMFTPDRAYEAQRLYQLHSEFSRRINYL
ncbi:hypothetical protein A1QC_09425 [Vibrio rumoiensis 1S-45]|uniref:Uncharacterized protein n=1 Tax=Vibrio rumoiensis 1S-45 TaxID=1188252 RepID=A0A1E5E2E6_9VIBR|nr:hypothetical protein A1QC_09425 [Vibrio rumoiensis 1S-45]